MAQALDLADRAKGTCSPNPAVGAIVVQSGTVVGRGSTRPKGQAHAEIVALEQAGEAARGAVMYVTLEPCGEGKRGLTGPCSRAILRAGISEVRIATLDRSPWVAGHGKRELEAAGLTIVVGEQADRAERLNEDYFKYVQTGLPWVTVKYAMTLDGKIATRTGSSRWISGEAARAWVGRQRSRADAVLVGVGTVLADDPALTARMPDGGLLPRQPLRVVLDSQGRLPADSRLASGGLPGRTLVLTTERGRAALRRLPAIDVCVLRPTVNGQVDPRAALEELGRRSVLHVLVEAGGTLVAALLAHGLVDRVAAFIAPRLAGGATAPTPVGGAGAAEMASALALRSVEMERLGDDVLVMGYVEGCLPGLSKS
ncbi:MAG: bifunctional diaminohydroxyphosphoribosylaminopyrimidine deaminase/5-amino-6-(5-phosphoribosylamino)uracil reductase RibD [Chloroflexi bacterium]|nr:bifunctional diaminohydroxyphosphoribosylaminopyrimidine deaminase/5-amino-6-(5-phosphoribosylamino)uracil reductase RibD [Chloroflexota bacterium]